jgi:hypothetical protein
MPASCIHGFQPGQCGRCSPDTSQFARRSTKSDPLLESTPEERLGWEIFYVPAVTGWRVRQPDTTALAASYRSLFLARKAVDALVASQPGASAKPGTSKAPAASVSGAIPAER